MSLTDYIEATHSRIRVARGIPLEDFKKLIEKRFNLKNAVIMRRTPLVQDKEVDTMTETNPDGTLCKQTATLNELRINEGNKIPVFLKVNKVNFAVIKHLKLRLS